MVTLSELNDFIKEFKEAVDKRKEPKLAKVNYDWLDAGRFAFEQRYKLDIGNGTYIETNGLIPEETVNFTYRGISVAYKVEFKGAYTDVRYRFHQIGDSNMYEEVVVIDEAYIRTMQDIEHLIKDKLDKFIRSISGGLR